MVSSQVQVTAWNKYSHGIFAMHSAVNFLEEDKKTVINYSELNLRVLFYLLIVLLYRFLCVWDIQIWEAQMKGQIKNKSTSDII